MCLTQLRDTPRQSAAKPVDDETTITEPPAAVEPDVEAPTTALEPFVDEPAITEPTDRVTVRRHG